MWESRMIRLFSILSYLSPHSQVTVHDLAREYEVNERTIQRDIWLLSYAKMGVFCDADGTIKISRNGYVRIRSWLVG